MVAASAFLQRVQCDETLLCPKVLQAEHLAAMSRHGGGGNTWANIVSVFLQNHMDCFQRVMRAGLHHTNSCLRQPHLNKVPSQWPCQPFGCWKSKYPEKIQGAPSLKLPLLKKYSASSSQQSQLLEKELQHMQILLISFAASTNRPAELAHHDLARQWCYKHIDKHSVTQTHTHMTLNPKLKERKVSKVDLPIFALSFHCEEPMPLHSI